MILPALFSSHWSHLVSFILIYSKFLQVKYYGSFSDLCVDSPNSIDRRLPSFHPSIKNVILLVIP